VLWHRLVDVPQVWISELEDTHKLFDPRKEFEFGPQVARLNFSPTVILRPLKALFDGELTARVSTGKRRQNLDQIDGC
jgi:hypothetical protein